ncbi:MAG: type II toxin-antitoxin system VapC family toxin [Caulobacteraceae bacterium]
MKLLLDTHVLLWVFDDPMSVSAELREALRRRTWAAASVASLWEIAIKSAKGKLEAPDDLPTRLAAAGFAILPVTARHAWAVRTAPAALRTADPFDRLLYAQARLQGLTLATRDGALLRSGIEVLEA